MRKYIPFHEFETIQGVLQALQRGRIDAVVYNEPIVCYMAVFGAVNGVQVLEESFGHEYYAIASPPGSPLAEKINRSLLQHTASRQWRLVLLKYLNYVFWSRVSLLPGQTGAGNNA